MAETVTKQETVQEPQAALKKIKKKWISLIAPKDFNNTLLGETYVADPANAMGKVVQVNLMNLTHDPKKQNIVVSFFVDEIKNNQANTVLIEYEIPPAHVKRLTKRAKAKIEDSFIYTTSDKVKMEIKLLIMTKAETHHSKLTLMRIESRKFLTELVKKETFIDLMKNIISGNVQRDLKTEIKKYHTIAAVVVRVAKKIYHQ